MIRRLSPDMLPSRGQERIEDRPHIRGRGVGTITQDADQYNRPCGHRDDVDGRPTMRHADLAEVMHECEIVVAHTIFNWVPRRSFTPPRRSWVSHPTGLLQTGLEVTRVRFGPWWAERSAIAPATT